MSDFERALLGSVTRFPGSIPILFDELREEDFSSPKHRAIFRAMGSLHEKKAPIDILTLSNELKGQGIQPSELIEMEDFAFDGMDLDYYSGKVKEDSRRRKLESFLSETLEETKDSSNDYQEVEGRTIQGIMEILDRGKERTLKTPEVLLKDILETYYRRKTQRGEWKLTGAPTGFKTIDETLGGLQDGTLGILAGRQHHGKSTVAMDILLSAAKSGTPSLYISLEQPSSEILLYLIQKESGIEPLRIKRGDLLESEERTLTQDIYSRFKTLPFLFEDRTRTLNEVVMKVRRMVFSQEVKLVVVDYLQLIENAVKGEPRHMQVAGISRALKRLAMDLNIPILALSQLNKNPEERVSGKIYLSDMRESEAISQDADYVLFIHRPTLMDRGDRDHLELAKNRHGKMIPRVNVTFDQIMNAYREVEDDGR
jgi:replicative DNA helicase